MRVIDPAILHDSADKTLGAPDETVFPGVENIDRLVAAIGQEIAIGLRIDETDVEGIERLSRDRDRADLPQFSGVAAACKAATAADAKSRDRASRRMGFLQVAFLIW
jgi:hypothetical protein